MLGKGGEASTWEVEEGRRGFHLGGGGREGGEEDKNCKTSPMHEPLMIIIMR